MAYKDSAEQAKRDPNLLAAIDRGIIEIVEDAVTYTLAQRKKYRWSNPEEWVRARCIASLIIAKGYPANRLRTEVIVPRRTPSDSADIVVYRDDLCREPYIVVETKAAGQTEPQRRQAVEQAFGNANSLRVPYCLYDEWSESYYFDVASHPPTERVRNRLGTKDAIPEQYGEAPNYRLIAGGPSDIAAVKPHTLESKIRRAHSAIWAGGRRDPLTAFDEWSKLLFAKVVDEKSTATGMPRRFQVGSTETTAAVSTRVHELFKEGCRDDPSIFPVETKLRLPDKKIFEVVEILQDLSFVRTDVDSIGIAFEHFFGSVFRGELGQYFTMRQISRFTVAMLDITHRDFVIDPTAGSGGFLLESLLQVWHRIESEFAGQPDVEIERLKIDFALQHVYGIEIHEVLARICKINLLLHHDGHTHVEGDRSCLDSVFALSRLNPPESRFTCIVGNPPFGDDVTSGDEDHLGSNTLDSFRVASGRSKVPSEHVIIERAVALLEPGGKLGFVVPDGMLNNQGELSNCPRIRRYLASNGVFEAIISLPDYAFRKSGAQNKTSLLFFRKFSEKEQHQFERACNAAVDDGCGEAEAIGRAAEALGHRLFMAEANFIGYTPSGAKSGQNDLCRASESGELSGDQTSTILGEYREFRRLGPNYRGSDKPDCMGVSFAEIWSAHTSNRLDPKYHLFKREESTILPADWIRLPLGRVMKRRDTVVEPSKEPDKEYLVITIAQTGELRPREAGKGNNPPEWRGSYFEDSTSTWYAAVAGDVVFSSIDLWKGCIAVVGGAFDGGLVTKEFPIYEIVDERLDPAFLSSLLRSRYYQRAFRAITTGHSNRRRTQIADFEALEIAFPADIEVQKGLVAGLQAASAALRDASIRLRSEWHEFSAVIDGGHGVNSVDTPPNDVVEEAEEQ